MPIFNLLAQVTVSAYTKVEANTLEEAIKISEERGVVIDLWWGDDRAKEAWIIEDVDGLPQNIHDERE